MAGLQDVDRFNTTYFSRLKRKCQTVYCLNFDGIHTKIYDDLDSEITIKYLPPRNSFLKVQNAIQLLGSSSLAIIN